MPVSEPFRRSRRRLAAAVAATALLSVAALGAPSSASAYSDHFCQFVTLSPAEVCYAPHRHSLQAVYTWSISPSYERVCAATFAVPYGQQNSDWRCDYGVAQKVFSTRVDGVGAIRSGDPTTFVGYARQDF